MDKVVEAEEALLDDELELDNAVLDETVEETPVDEAVDETLVDVEEEDTPVDETEDDGTPVDEDTVDEVADDETVDELLTACPHEPTIAGTAPGPLPIATRFGGHLAPVTLAELPMCSSRLSQSKTT